MGTSGPLPVWLDQRSLHCVPCFSAGLSVLASFATFLVFGRSVCFFCSLHWGQTHWGLGRRCQGPGQMLSPCLSLPPRPSKSVGVRRRSSNMAHEWMCAGQQQGCSWSQAVPKLALAPEWRTWEPGSLWPSRAALLMLPANLDGTEGLALPCPGDPAPPHGQLRLR